MLTALTISKKPHQIATGFDQSSHATLIGLPPRALSNAHESVIRPTYKARSSQPLRRPRPAVRRGTALTELSGAAGHSNVPDFMSRRRAAIDLPVLNVIFLRSWVVPPGSFAARGVFDGQASLIAHKAAPEFPLQCQHFDRCHIGAVPLCDRRYFGDRRAYRARGRVRAAGTLHPAAHPQRRRATPLPAGVAQWIGRRRRIPNATIVSGCSSKAGPVAGFGLSLCLICG